MIALGGTALIVDHNHLVGQRDILQSAADAASLAATLELERVTSSDTDEEVEARIFPIARKYAVLNVLGNVADADLTAENVGVTFNFDRDSRTVARVHRGPDTGRTLFSNWLYDYLGTGTMKTQSGVEAVATTVELVLAIDLSDSMNLDLAGSRVGHADSKSRMSIVRAAATDLVEVLMTDAATEVAVGIVPWDFAVRLTATARATWVSEGWAEYPDSRHYALTYACAPGSACSDTAQDDDLPDTSPEEWEGCLDEHRGDHRACRSRARSRMVRSSGDQGIRPDDLSGAIRQSLSVHDEPLPDRLRTAFVLRTGRAGAVPHYY